MSNRFVRGVNTRNLAAYTYSSKLIELALEGVHDVLTCECKYNAFRPTYSYLFRAIALYTRSYNMLSLWTFITAASLLHVPFVGAQATATVIASGPFTDGKSSPMYH